MAFIRKTHVAIASALLSYLLVLYRPEYSIWGSVFLTFISLAGGLLGVRYLYVHILYPKLFSPLRDIPTAPGGSFWNGHGWTILKEPTGIPHRRWVNTIKNDGLILYHYFANNERVMLSSPDTLREVLVTKCYDFEKPALARVNLGRILGVGVLLAEGDEHKLQRKNLLPAFQYRHVRDLYAVFWAKSGQMLEAVTSEIKKKQTETLTDDGYSIIDFGNWLSRCTLDIIGLAGMGVDFNSISDPDNELNQTYKRIFSPAGRSVRLFFLINQMLPMWIVERLPFKRNSDIVNAANVVQSVSRKLILEKQAKMVEKPDSIDKDIISVALSSGVFSVENL